MKKNKNKIIAGVVVLLLIFGISRIDFKSVDDFYNVDNEASWQTLNSDDSSTSSSDLNGALQNREGSATSNSEHAQGANIPGGSRTNSSGTDDSGGDSGSGNIRVSIIIDVRNLNKPENLNRLRPEIRRHVPASGFVLNRTTIEVPNGSTAFDVLLKATRLHRIQMEFQGANENIYNSVYIKGINHIYEFSAGNESGWMYSVNGTFPNFGMSAMSVKNNDLVRMVYTVDLGCDVGHSMKSCN